MAEKTPAGDELTTLNTEKEENGHQAPTGQFITPV